MLSYPRVVAWSVTARSITTRIPSYHGVRGGDGVEEKQLNAPQDFLAEIPETS